YGIALCYNNIGNIYRDWDNLHLALDYYNKAHHICDEIGDKLHLVITLHNIAQIYVRLEDLGTAIQFCQESLRFAKEIGAKLPEVQNYHTLAKVYEKKEDSVQALIFYKKYIQCKESMFNEEKTRQFAEIQARYEAEKRIKEAEIYRLKNVELKREIDERKQVEETLIQAKAEAEAANQAKSVFLANMSHELRTPLNGILGYAQILANTPLTEKQKEGLEIIRRSGEHLLTLINEILDLSKIEAGRLDIEPANFRLLDMLQNICETIRLRAEQKALHFMSDIDDNLPPTVMGDEKRIRQILLNLLSNAVKFTLQGYIKLKVGYHYEQIRFQVEDSGIGIPADKITDIFEPFCQISDARLQSEGTGLGLAISQRLAQKMGSTLHVKSDVDTGTTFWFDLDLPVAEDSPEANGVAPRILGYEGKRRSILIADDKTENRIVLKDLLQPLNFDFIEAVDGKDALDKATKYLPDIILMDLVMPQLNGIDVVRYMRKDPNLQHIVVIMVSASAFEYTRQECLDAGCDDFLTKPIHLDTLLDRLSRHLHLKWVYEETREEQPTPEGEIYFPPPEYLQQIYHLADMGSVRRIEAVLDHLETTNAKYLAFTTQIRERLKDFQLDKICELTATLPQD
ncbi:MAG: response regulator, partial [Gemmatimonadetes bacterium]